VVISVATSAGWSRCGIKSGMKSDSSIVAN
jgi:hypothetical protein